MKSEELKKFITKILKDWLDEPANLPLLKKQGRITIVNVKHTPKETLFLDRLTITSTFKENMRKVIPLYIEYLANTQKKPGLSANLGLRIGSHIQEYSVLKDQLEVILGVPAGISIEMVDTGTNQKAQKSPACILMDTLTSMLGFIEYITENTKEQKHKQRDKLRNTLHQSKLFEGKTPVRKQWAFFAAFATKVTKGKTGFFADGTAMRFEKLCTEETKDTWEKYILEKFKPIGIKKEHIRFSSHPNNKTRFYIYIDEAKGYEQKSEDLSREQQATSHTSARSAPSYASTA